MSMQYLNHTTNDAIVEGFDAYNLLWISQLWTYILATYILASRNILSMLKVMCPRLHIRTYST